MDRFTVSRDKAKGEVGRPCYSSFTSTLLDLTPIHDAHITTCHLQDKRTNKNKLTRHVSELDAGYRVDRTCLMSLGFLA
jgi:hypothetical protein